MLAEEDSIITLNYDLVADATLYDLGKDTKGELDPRSRLGRSYALLGGVKLVGGERPTLLREDSNKGFFIKLHGSVDWLYCPNRDCAYHREFFHNWPGTPGVHAFITDPCILCGRPLALVMIPPALGKSLEGFPKMGALWSLAYRKLAEAGRWLAIGVSLAESDYYLRTMLREARARHKNLELAVVNPNSEHRDRLAELIRPTTIEAAESLSEYLARVQHRSRAEES